MVATLQRQGRLVIGPVARDGVISHEVIDSADDLPVGWTETQSGGRYRLEPTGTEERFAFSSPSTSWKRFLYPERTMLLRVTREGDDVVVAEPNQEVKPVAFFGIRSCDLAAIGIQDRVFLDPEAVDPTYQALREDVFIVAAACGSPAQTCFCESMGPGPSPRLGYDLTLRELSTITGIEYLVEEGSKRGRVLLAEIPGRDVYPSDFDAASAQHESAVALMERSIAPADPPAAAKNLDHSRWDNIAERCLACGNCTMVCPTCFCSTTVDTTDLSGDVAERWREWDSCFTLDFSHMHGGSVRTTVASRYRQWLLHKLVTWQDQFGTSGCVGCGRCITWCPVGIDLTQEIALLAKTEDLMLVGTAEL